MQRRRRESYGRRGLARSGQVIGSHEGVSSSTAAGLEAVASGNLGPGWLWPLRMAKSCEWAGDERKRKAEHGGVGTPHSRGASGMVIGSGAGEVGSFSWRSRARRLVGSVARRRGGSSARTGPVGETPEPESRRSARSDHQASSWGSDAQAELRRVQLFCRWKFP